MIINLVVSFILFCINAYLSYALLKKINKLDKSFDKTIGELNIKLNSVPIYKPEKNSFEPEKNEVEIGEGNRIPYEEISYLSVDGSPKQKIKIYR